MDKLFLLALALGAGAYLYFKVFKKGACSCGENSCTSKAKKGKVKF